MPHTHHSPPRAAFLFLLTFTLAACAIVSPGIADPTATPISQPIIPTVDTLPTATAIAPTESPPPTPVPASIGFVGRVSSAPPGSITALSLEGAQVAAATRSMLLDVTDIDAFDSPDPLGPIRFVADHGPLVIVVAGSELAEATRAVAREYPAIKFVGVDQPRPERGQPAVDSLANYFVIGEPGNRPDEEAFIAGALAGLVTQERKVGVIVTAGTLEGRLYRNGFLHGLRYTCGDCELTAIELDPADTAAGERAAKQLKNARIDVVFAASGPAGESAVNAGAALGMWAIGSGWDYAKTVPAGAEFVLASVVRRPDLSLPALIDSLLAQGSAPQTPFALAQGNLSFAETLGPDVSPGIIDILGSTMNQLAEGALDTGVDLTTGEEK